MRHPTFSLSNRRRTQRGFSLLEVLIALLVLSIGLLGLAALQAAGLRSSHGAYLSSQATLLAYDMADRIRAADRIDPGLLGNYTFNGEMADYGCDGLDPAVAITMGVDDRDNWLNAVACYLPSARAVVETAGDDYLVTVEWIDTQAESHGETEWRYQVRVRL
jgi:type IV pilus assembly protein PilV